MAVKRNVQLGELKRPTNGNGSGRPHAANNADGVAALTRLVKYCETEASDLKLAFVAYCLSIANVALTEEFGVPEGLEPGDQGKA